MPGWRRAPSLTQLAREPDFGAGAGSPGRLPRHTRFRRKRVPIRAGLYVLLEVEKLPTRPVCLGRSAEVRPVAGALTYLDRGRNTPDCLDIESSPGNGYASLVL